MLSGGLGNPGVAILELLGAAITSVLAVVAPVVVVTLVALLLVIVLRRRLRRTPEGNAAVSG